jgi:hypothetical protein
MSLDIDQITQHVHDTHNWIASVYQGIAESNIVASPPAPTTCAGFGDPGWAPFCFLNGNPLFNAFDSFQFFIQSCVVSLHDFLVVSDCQ